MKKDKLYKKINTTDGIIPKLYGLPKIHKQNVPLRLMVSFTGSPTYELSKFLSDILATLIGISPYHIRNTQDWVTAARTIQMEKDEELVSFDVISLFTSMPTDIAVQVVRQKLCDMKLMECTSLSPDDICEFLTFF